MNESIESILKEYRERASAWNKYGMEIRAYAIQRLKSGRPLIMSYSPDPHAGSADSLDEYRKQQRVSKATLILFVERVLTACICASYIPCQKEHPDLSMPSLFPQPGTVLISTLETLKSALREKLAYELLDE